jgi:hypothetical protein
MVSDEDVGNLWLAKALRDVGAVTIGDFTIGSNNKHSPDYINIKVDELTGGKPFERIDDVISQEELRKISEDYKRIAGFSLESLK